MDNKTYLEKIKAYDLTQAQYAESYYWRLAEPGLLQLNRYTAGLSCEAAELQDAVGKFLRDGRAVDTLNIKEEAGDVLVHIGWIANLFGVTLEDLMKMSIAKLEQRYPTGFAENCVRDTKAEQLAMMKAIETEADREQARELKRLLTEGDGGTDETT